MLYGHCNFIIFKCIYVCMSKCMYVHLRMCMCTRYIRIYDNYLCCKSY